MNSRINALLPSPRLSSPLLSSPLLSTPLLSSPLLFSHFLSTPLLSSPASQSTNQPLAQIVCSAVRGGLLHCLLDSRCCFCAGFSTAISCCLVVNDEPPSNTSRFRRYVVARPRAMPVLQTCMSSTTDWKRVHAYHHSVERIQVASGHPWNKGL